MTEVALLNVTLVRPAHEYFHHAVLEITEGLLELGTTKWQLALALLGCWIIVFFVIMKGKYQKYLRLGIISVELTIFSRCLISR